jgi:predicted Zn finger-like uncharacterized protein
MKSTCSSCGTTFRIDPRKVPAGGVQARCSRCGGVFSIAAPAESATVRPAPGAESEGHVGPLPELMPREAAPPPPAAPAASIQPTPPAAAAPPETASAPEAVPSGPRPSPIFGRPDPHGKARRLARALVSDIAVYNPERRDRGLEQGTLRQEFREEIRKSWEEYVGQVGESLARGTPYFREALNEILAGGRTVF